MQMLLNRTQNLLAQESSSLQAAIVSPEGSLNADNAAQFHQQLRRAVLSPQYSSLLVNMERVDLIDSAGLMVLVSALRLAKNANKRLLMCSVSQSVRMILELTRLDHVLEIIENPVG